EFRPRSSALGILARPALLASAATSGGRLAPSAAGLRGLRSLASAALGFALAAAAEHLAEPLERILRASISTAFGFGVFRALASRLRLAFAVELRMIHELEHGHLGRV